jgi:hypothetical protein
MVRCKTPSCGRSIAVKYFGEEVKPRRLPDRKFITLVRNLHVGSPPDGGNAGSTFRSSLVDYLLDLSLLPVDSIRNPAYFGRE